MNTPQIIKPTKFEQAILRQMGFRSVGNRCEVWDRKRDSRRICKLDTGKFRTGLSAAKPFGTDYETVERAIIQD